VAHCADGGGPTGESSKRLAFKNELCYPVLQLAQERRPMATEALAEQSPDVGQEDVMSFCRRCGGERHHRTLFEKTKTWDGGSAPVDGGDTWSTLQCGGCQEITFVHEHWFSEDYEMTADGCAPIIHREYFPPAPRRKPLEQSDLIMFLRTEERWVELLLHDVYSAAGMGAYGLAAMGARAILDHLVTSRAGLAGNDFPKKAMALVASDLITPAQKEVLVIAFDAGSAAIHRGFAPSETDFFTLLDITESLIQRLCISPGRAAQQAEEAKTLKTNTPPRR
jgi:hypothetical protein